MLDDFTARHLNAWLESTVPTDYREATLSAILRLLADYPELPETHSWSEIRLLAERYAA